MTDCEPEFDVDELIEADQQQQLEASSASLLPPLESVNPSHNSRKRRYIDDDDIDEALEYAQLEAIEASLVSNESVAAEKNLQRINDLALQCVECKAIAHHVPFYKAFKIPVCRDCQQQFPSKYKLITKTTAKTDYMCSESELSTLPLMLKPNPNEHRSAMKLYRLCDILPLALKRFAIDLPCPKDGDPSDSIFDEARITELQNAIAAEKQRRELEKLNRDVAKRQKVRQAAVKEERVRSFDVKAAQKRNAGHKHTFISSNGKQKCSECNFEVEYEEF